MQKPILSVRSALLATLFVMSVAHWAVAQATNEIRVVEIQGKVELALAGTTTWTTLLTNQVLHALDRVRTGPNSRVALRWSDQSVVPFGASTELEIMSPHSSEAQHGLHLIRGIISFFHRDKPGRIRIITRGAVAGVEGTEFVLSAAETNGMERTTLSVIDGKVSFGNDQGTLVLTNGQQAVATPGQSPVRTAGFIANNLLQWSFYYPAVLDPADLQLTESEAQVLEESLAAYRSGDLLRALEKYPPSRQAGSDAERIYHAALLLSVGDVAEAETDLAAVTTTDSSSRPVRLAAALRQLVSAVKREPTGSIAEGQLTTELLAASYYEQSRAVRETSLQRARSLARQATTVSPESGFAWARVAELEFSFGQSGKAMKALDKSLSLAPRNAQALALKGFVLAAQNDTKEAIQWFERALVADSALGNAWLGRGLCRIRNGDIAAGREDLLVAAALEPRRAVLRSYLSKADALVGDHPRAKKELELARSLDPNDPTAWLYSALRNQQHNQVNDAIRDLEKSQDLNDNRSVYRSQLLLDQDNAVRSANLAAMYRDAGMTEVATREAARAVNYDYANYSAHLFLANSYNALSDPNLINRRYETPAENEFLLAALLAPVSAGPISPSISQQEYSPYFQQNRLGLVSSTEYLSRGAWTQSGAQYGTFENFNYSAEAFYRTDPGQRRNDDIEQRQLAFSLKHQITPDDSVYFQARLLDSEGGDLAQYYHPNMESPTFRYTEKQEPLLALGYHHQWSPGVHTLFLATRLEDTYSVTNQTQPTVVTFRPDDPLSPGTTVLTGLQPLTMRQSYRNDLEIYSAEAQQIWQQAAHNTIAGIRFQDGQFRTANLQNFPSTAGGAFPDPPEPAAQQNITTDFWRFNVYGYHQWELTDWLELIGGVAYDRMTFPRNIRHAPISNDEKTKDDILPKAGIIFRPAPNTVARFAYTRSLSGASLDQSYQLEPSQVAGFIQSYRSIIPESVAGANVGAEFETFGLSLEQKFPTGTYLGLSGELLYSEVHRTVGAFDVLPDQLDFAIPSGLREHLDFREQSLVFTANQLVARDWAFGGRYRVSQAVLNDDLVDVHLPSGSPGSSLASRRFEGILNQASLFTIYNHPCGFFAQADAQWYSQDNREDSSGLADDEFWQFNVIAGYRFPHRKAEISVGLLNIGDQDYRLNPINIYNEMPRDRTFVARLRLNF